MLNNKMKTQSAHNWITASRSSFFHWLSFRRICILEFLLSSNKCSIFFSLVCVCVTQCVFLYKYIFDFWLWKFHVVISDTHAMLLMTFHTVVRFPSHICCFVTDKPIFFVHIEIKSMWLYIRTKYKFIRDVNKLTTTFHWWKMLLSPWLLFFSLFGIDRCHLRYLLCTPILAFSNCTFWLLACDAALRLRRFYCRVQWSVSKLMVCIESATADTLCGGTKVIIGFAANAVCVCVFVWCCVRDCVYFTWRHKFLLSIDRRKLKMSHRITIIFFFILFLNINEKWETIQQHRALATAVSRTWIMFMFILSFRMTCVNRFQMIFVSSGVSEIYYKSTVADGLCANEGEAINTSVLADV